jgi:hypothetical protein
MIHPGNCAWCKRPLIGAGHRWVGYVKVYTCKGCDKETFRPAITAGDRENDDGTTKEADMILTEYGKYTILSSTTPTKLPKTHRDLYREISKLPIFGSVQFDAEHAHRASVYKANISKRKGIKLIHKWTDGILTITRLE